MEDLVILVDESGDAGIKSLRKEGKAGSSPYFVLAATVFPKSEAEAALQVLNETEMRIGRAWAHATDLSHAQTVFFCRQTLKVNMRLFAVMSNKATLGNYSDSIRHDPHKFYNKCAVYLLEKIGKYLLGKKMSRANVEVIFEERNHDYDAMRRYILKIKERPIHVEARYLRVFNVFDLKSRKKQEEQLLKFADLAAHSVYQIANKSRSNFEIPEPRYLEELQSKFGADRDGQILGNGIKCIHSLADLDLDRDVTEKVEAFRGRPLKTLPE